MYVIITLFTYLLCVLILMYNLKCFTILTMITIELDRELDAVAGHEPREERPAGDESGREDETRLLPEAQLPAGGAVGARGQGDPLGLGVQRPLAARRPVAVVEPRAVVPLEEEQVARRRARRVARLAAQPGQAPLEPHPLPQGPRLAPLLARRRLPRARHAIYRPRVEPPRHGEHRHERLARRQRLQPRHDCQVNSINFT